MVIFCEASVSIWIALRRSPAAFCVGPRRSLCRVPALSRFLCWAPALSVSVLGAVCVGFRRSPALSVSGLGASWPPASSRISPPTCSVSNCVTVWKTCSNFRPCFTTAQVSFLGPPLCLVLLAPPTVGRLRKPLPPVGLPYRSSEFRLMGSGARPYTTLLQG